MIQKQIDDDLKTAMLAGDKDTASTLRIIKSALQYEAVNMNVRDEGLSDEQSQKVLAREVKKRAEAAELYKNANESGRAAAEESEKKIIEKYLPQQASEEEVKGIVEDEVAKLGATSPADMGKVIGAVRARLGATADGALIARIVKEKLN